MFPHTRLCVKMFASILLALMFSLEVKASTLPTGDTVDLPTTERILFIGHLNFDCIEDTVLSDMNTNLEYIPMAIGWGRWNDIYKGCSEENDSPSDKYPFVSRTRIEYPNWEGLHCTAAFQEVNGDTLPDIIFFLRGRISTDEEYQDTARAIVLFGQRHLDTISVVPLDSVGIFEYNKFFAIDLRQGRDIVDPDKRDLSGVTSHMLLPTSEDAPSDSSLAPRLQPDNKTNLKVRVHPNPAVNLARIEGNSIPPGEYAVEIVAVNGEVQHRQRVLVTASGELLRTMNVESLASGYYIVHLRQQGILRATYPIIIKH